MPKHPKGFTFIELLFFTTVITIITAMLLPAFAQHGPGAREQWQPQFTVGGWDADRRLNNRVTVDILERSAKTALAIISKKTGVSLGIAPEDIATVGERKLCLFVRDDELRSVMVQIPEALRECHWDIDKSGTQPVYCLHRNAGGADPAAASGWEKEQLRDLAKAKRVERLEAAMRALAMSPEELREFEKEDLFLAMAMQDQNNRDEAELFFGLPSADLQKFIDTGRVQPKYSDLSPVMKAGVEEMIKRVTNPVFQVNLPGWKEPEEMRRTREFEQARVKRWREGPEPRVDFADIGQLGILSVGLPNIFLCTPIPSRFPTERQRSEFVSLFERTEAPNFASGIDQRRAEANRIVSEWIEKGRAAQVQENQQELGQEPTDPMLLKPISLRTSGRVELSRLQQEIAGESGLSLVSDYFTQPPIDVSGSLRQPVALWRLLNALCSESQCTWKKAGSYLVFHHIKWQELAPGEMPEDVITRYRQKVAKVGHLTIADTAEFAVMWENRAVRAYGIPMDLQEAGLNYASPDLLLYASLTPKQIAAARRPPGLPCRELTAPQRKRLAEILDHQLVGERITMNQALARGHFRIEEIVKKPGRIDRGGGLIEVITQTYTEVHFFVQLGGNRPRFIMANYRFPEIAPKGKSAGAASTKAAKAK